MPAFEVGEQGEDWEDWLRWDPTAEPTSPDDDGTFHSGSSKNDSPLQDPVLPAMTTDTFSKDTGSETLAPPMIMGRDGLDFGMGGGGLPGDETFMFGAGDDAGISGTDFNVLNSFQPLQVAEDHAKLDSSTGWALPSTAMAEQMDFPALLQGNTQQLGATDSSATSAITPGFHNSSPGSASHNRTSVSSNSPVHAADQPKKRGGRKRKADIQMTKDEEQNASNGDSGQDGDGPPKKTSHNVIEKRYRNNLNDKIVELRNSVPSLRAMGRANGSGNDEDLEGLTPAHKLNKATVMGKATEYIKHLEKRNKTMADEMALLKTRMAAVEAAIGKSRDRSSSVNDSSSGGGGGGSTRSRQPSGASSNGSQAQQGFLNVPQEQMRFTQQQQQAIQQQQQQYLQPQQQPVYARPPNEAAHAQDPQQYVYGRGGGAMNKVMMGAMAGIMVMEGFNEQSQDDSRQLAGIPGFGGLFRRGLGDASLSHSPAALVRHAALPMLKVFCVVGALLYLLAPLLTWSPRKKQKTRRAVRLPQAPSLASPVEVRRKAWFTAVQTVYVPRHFLLEVTVVTTKMIKLSFRRLVGSEMWNSLTGTNEEEEAARIKAWDIALDAQLAGGDAEVSYYRLLLTIMASGTLPDSPTRLMQKAIHFRVFFWEVANAGYGNIFGFKQFTEKVGKIYWDSARRQQRELVHASAQGRPTVGGDQVELLPDHLAALVELECDEVLDDEMIQRAWNLAWNKPSAYNTTANAARDAVVEDHAIRSPLDAVAAWYANVTIDDTLLDALDEHPSSLDMEYYIGLAVSIAPPASATHVRTLAAKAMLSNTQREANVLTALHALPVMSTGGGPGTLFLVEHGPAAPDVRLALTIAKLLSLLAPGSPASAQSRAYTALAHLSLPPASLTLLTTIATYRLLRAAAGTTRPLPPPAAARGLEDLAASLRLWVGTSAGRHAGLRAEHCGRIVEVCVGVAKRIGGWEEERDRDSGYGSGSGSLGGSSPIRGVGEGFGVA